MSRVGAPLGLAVVVVAALGCGKKDDRPAPPPPRPAPALPPAPSGPPVAPPAPTALPATFTLDELQPRLPTVAAVRLTTPLALDGSGKQALGKGCVTAAGAKLAMHLLADAYGVAHWQIKVRETTKGEARGEFIADFELGDGFLHARGVVAASQGCAAGEVGLDLYFSKLVPVTRPAPAPKPPTPPTPVEPPAVAPTP